MERITSKTNQLVKDTKKLLNSSKERQEKRLFVLEGARLCFDVLNSVYKPKYLFITQKAYDRYADDAMRLADCSESVYIISEEISQKLSETETSQGIFAVCRIPDGNRVSGSKLIALDRVQDPANIGAIFRTAEALGIDGIITYGCCDIYNPKTLRASMGGVLRLKTESSDSLEDTLKALKGNYRIYSTVPDSKAKEITEVDFSLPSVCVIGNEANGVEDNIKALSDDLITVPMKGRAESLNAAAAAAVVMWEMLR